MYVYFIRKMSSRLRSTRRSALRANLDGADLKVETSDSKDTNENDSIDQLPLTPNTYRKKSKISFGYEDYLTPELLNQVSRHSNYILRIKSIEQQFDERVPNVRSSWFYQRVVSWLYAVCDSYVTTTLFQIKPLWRDISFNEFLLLEDILRCIDIGSQKAEEDYNADFGDNNDQRLFVEVRTKILDQLPRGRHTSNVENNEPVSQDMVVNEYLTGINELHLVYDYTKVTIDSLSTLTQFEILYHVIKYIESKSMIFRNYVTSKPDLFKVTQLGVSKNQKQNEVIFTLQNPFTIVIKRVLRDKISQFHIPIKLKHCTIRYEEENQLVYLDYTKEIETYLGSIQLDYEVLSYSFDGLLQLYDSSKKDETSSYNFKNGADKLLMERITNGAELLIQTCKVLVQREKDKLLQELLTRRKRSSRLLVREEEVRRKEIGEQLSEKLDKRQAFLKHRHRSVARLTKKCKDLLWSDLWIRFNQDVKTVTRKNGKYGFSLEAVAESSSSSSSSSLSAADRYVLQSGDTFKEPIIKMNTVITEEDNESKTSEQTNPSNMSPQELPTDLCITQDDISRSLELGIPLDRDITAPDNCTDWIFQCTCEPGRKLTNISMADNEETNREKYLSLKLINGTPIICCDICSRWQHWNCQDPSLIQCVSLSAGRSLKDIPTARIFTQRDFGTVPMNLSDLNPYRSRETSSSLEQDVAGHRSSRRRTTSTRRTRAQDNKASNYVSPYREQGSSSDDDNDNDDNNNDNATVQQETDLRPKRPTDRRTRFGECAVFMCGYCLSKYEKQLRDTFVPELELLRAKQKRQHEDRERRKLEKLRKKEEEEARARAEAQKLVAAKDGVPADITTTAPMVNPVVSTHNTVTTENNQYNIVTPSNGTATQTQTYVVTGESAFTSGTDTVTTDPNNGSQ